MGPDGREEEGPRLCAPRRSMRGGWRWLRPGHLGTEAEHATFRTLHSASLTAPELREGLTSGSAERAVRHLRDLLGVPAVALTDTVAMLAWDGRFGHHERDAAGLAASVLESGNTVVRNRQDFPCTNAGCGLRQVVVSPLVVEDRVVGTLQAFASSASAGLVRAVAEVCLLYTSPSPRDLSTSRMPSSA